MSKDVLSTEEAKNTGIEELLDKPSTTRKGLSTSEVNKRIAQYGFNEIPEKKVNPVLKFLAYTLSCLPQEREDHFGR